jgi:isopentenyl-diphosphate delta-isomerase
MIDEVVSSDSENLILVSPQDEVLGTLDKARCHDGQGILHRAFSIFLFDEANRLLIQQRAAGKRLWPLYWANSCCSHPRVGESLELATTRRLREELGVSARLSFAYQFEYQAQYGDIGAEHELCSVYLGRVQPQLVNINTTEVVDTRWISLADLDQWIQTSPSEPPIAPWFGLEWLRFRDEYSSVLEAFLSTKL